MSLLRYVADRDLEKDYRAWPYVSHDFEAISLACFPVDRDFLRASGSSMLIVSDLCCNFDLGLVSLLTSSVICYDLLEIVILMDDLVQDMRSLICLWT